tara:strand:+ start:1775 stop:2662 length:888 start_codon:yes stop_codon:yes gene_type:complete
MSSIATGIGEAFRGGSSITPSLGRPSKVFPAQVLDICMSTDHKTLYKSPKDIGKIIFRDVFKDQDKAEIEIKKTAYPLDRSIIKYPLPGEEVLIFVAMGERDTKNAGESTIGACYFYTANISTNHNVTYNVEPFLATSNAKIHPTNKLPIAVNEKRFKEKTKDIAAVTEGEDVKIYKQLSPKEGDFILQGRFGNTIRFGAFKGTAASAAGSGITIIKQDSANTSKEADMMTTPDEDALDTQPASETATIILTTTQQIDNLLACSNLNSLRVQFTDAEARSKTQWEVEDSSKLTSG